MTERQRRWRGPGWPWQAYERRGDAGYNVAFKGDLPNMWLGVILLMVILYGLFYLVGMFERSEDDHTGYLDAVAACETWAELRDGLDSGQLSQSDQVEMAREIEGQARGSEVDFRIFGGIADRLERGRSLGAYPDRADEKCAEVSQAAP